METWLGLVVSSGAALIALAGAWYAWVQAVEAKRAANAAEALVDVERQRLARDQPPTFRVEYSSDPPAVTFHLDVGPPSPFDVKAEVLPGGPVAGFHAGSRAVANGVPLGTMSPGGQSHAARLVFKSQLRGSGSGPHGEGEQRFALEIVSGVLAGHREVVTCEITT